VTLLIHILVAEIVSLVDSQIASSSHGRLFAIVYVNGSQRRVTDGDLVMYNYDMGLDIGEKICLDKVRKCTCSLLQRGVSLMSPPRVLHNNTKTMFRWFLFCLGLLL
jgi:hypothetical protein